MWTNPITVVETLTFQRQADVVWSDEERGAFVDFIAKNPEAGDVIKDGGGVRKVRWDRAVQENAAVLGSSIFYNFDTPLYLLLVYAKTVRTDVSPDAKKAVREFAESIEQGNRRPAAQRKK